MKKTFFQRLAAAALAAVLSTVLILPTGAASPAAPDPAFASGFTELGKLVQTDGRVIYQLDDPSLLSSAALRRSRAALPASYDLRTQGESTPVRDQNPYGSCWSFGPMASIESNLLKNGNADHAATLDLSERQLAWYTFNGVNTDADKSVYAGGDTFYPVVETDDDFVQLSGSDIYNVGGSRWNSAPTLARWYGAAAESDVPYLNQPGMDAPAAGTQTIAKTHVAQIYHLPEPIEISYVDDNDPSLGLSYSLSNANLSAVKQALVDYGAVSVGYYADDSMSGSVAGDASYSQEHNSYYYAGDNLANHEVTIIGWDDDFPKTSFTSQPAGDGAWLIKNSWGDAWGDAGYFWLSYYDHSFSEPTSFLAEDALYDAQTPSHTYANAYQYDGIGYGETVFTSSGLVSVANRFTARGDEQVQALAFHTPTAGCSVTLSVYRNASAADPQSGEKLYDNSASPLGVKYAGFHTLDLGSDAFTLAAGDTFTVVLTVQTADGSYILSCESAAEDSLYCAIDVQAGQTFYYEEDSGEWTDIAGEIIPGTSASYLLGNGTVKAYTNDAPAAPALTAVEVSSFDSRGVALGDAVNVPISQDASTLSVPAYTASIKLAPTLSAAGTYQISAGGQTYDAGDEIPRAVFAGTDTITITCSVAGAVRANVYTLSVLPVPATILSAGALTLTDEGSVIPYDTALSAAKTLSGADYDKVQAALLPYGGQDSFTMLNVTAMYDGNPLVLSGEQEVSLAFTLPDAYDAAKTKLFFADLSSGSAVLTLLSDQVENGKLTISTAALNGYYLLAETRQAPSLPTLADITYDPEQTLADITLPTVDGGSWAWDEDTLVPSVPVTSYAATFTPGPGSDYCTLSADIPLTVGKATPQVTDAAAADTYTYGDPLSTHSASGRAVHPLSGAIVAGSYTWKNGDIYPTVTNTGYPAVFTPTDSDNYASVELTAATTVSPKEITVDANSANKVYGDPLADLDFTVPAGALVGSDTKADLGLSLTSAATSASPVGPYDIIKDTCTSTNYTVTVSGNDKLTVIPRPISITPDPVSITYGDPLPTHFTFTATGLVSGDAPTVITADLSAVVDGQAVAGEYLITGTARADNYIVAVRDGKLTIQPLVLDHAGGAIDNQSSLAATLAAKIRLAGSFQAGPDARLIITDVTADSQGNTVFSAAIGDQNDIVALFDVAPEGVAGIHGPMSLTLPVDPSYHGKNITILHYLKAGEKDQTGKSYDVPVIDMYEQVPVQDGAVTITVYSLSPFALLSSADSIQPDSGVMTPEGEITSPNTGDQIALWSIIGILIAAAVVLIVILIIKKRGNRK